MGKTISYPPQKNVPFDLGMKKWTQNEMVPVRERYIGKDMNKWMS